MFDRIIASRFITVKWGYTFVTTLGAETSTSFHSIVYQDASHALQGLRRAIWDVILEMRVVLQRERPLWASTADVHVISSGSVAELHCLSRDYGTSLRERGGTCCSRDLRQMEVAATKAMLTMDESTKTILLSDFRRCWRCDRDRNKDPSAATEIEVDGQNFEAEETASRAPERINLATSPCLNRFLGTPNSGEEICRYYWAVPGTNKLGAMLMIDYERSYVRGVRWIC